MMWNSRCMRRARAAVTSWIVCGLVWGGMMSTIFAPTAVAGGRPVYHSCGQVYHSAHYVAPQAAYVATQVQKDVTVVNNVIAYPVAVPYLQPIAQQGQTGFAYTSVQSLFPQYNPGVAVAQASTLAQQSNALFRDALAGQQRFAAQELDSKERIGLTIATAQAFDQIMAATSRIQSQKLRSTEVRETRPVVPVDPAPAAEPPGEDQTFDAQSESAELYAEADAILKASCVSCHPAYNSWSKLKPAKQNEMIARMMSHDPDYMMPRAADKKSPGKPIDPADIILLSDTRKSRSR